MSDWADEIAKQFTVFDTQADVATALRKAKADGMREVADCLEATKIEPAGTKIREAINLMLDAFARSCRDYAHAIEKGEPS